MLLRTVIWKTTMEQVKVETNTFCKQIILDAHLLVAVLIVVVGVVEHQDGGHQPGNN